MLRRPSAVLGREDGHSPVRASCEVLVRRRQGSYWLLSFSSLEIAKRARPGQFVNIAVGAQGALLRRPFSIAGGSWQGTFAGTVDVIFDAHGPGTEWLTTVGTHDALDVVGPLGNAFPMPQRKVACLLVGGGYGAAPLYYLAEELTRRGLRVDMIAGAASQERLLNPLEARRLTSSATFTTEDGSFGERGRVTDVLEDVAAACRTGVVYACGPNPMLRAVSERCRELGLPVQVAVEERMACGTGVCFTCVMPVRMRGGAVRMKRSCIDGPVFNGASVAWDQSRYGSGPDVLDEVDDEPLDQAHGWTHDQFEKGPGWRAHDELDDELDDQVVDEVGDEGPPSVEPTEVASDGGPEADLWGGS